MPPDLLRVMRRYVRAERTEAGSRDRVFTSRQAGSLARQRVAQLFDQYARTAGLRKAPGLGVHSLRHSQAVHALDAGLDVTAVQDLLRHRSMTSTLVYARIQQRPAQRLPGYAREVARG